MRKVQCGGTARWGGRIKMDRGLRSLIAVSIFVGVICIRCLFIALIFMRREATPKDEYSYEDYRKAYKTLGEDLDAPYSIRTDKEYKEFIEKDLGLKYYIYTENDLKRDSGRAYILIRTMVIDKHQDGYYYCLTFAHECMHMVRFRQDERYISFETFKYLYEHEDEELHNVGVWYGYRVLRDKYSGDYDIKEEIVNYLNN